MPDSKHTMGPWIRNGTIVGPNQFEIDIQLDESGDNWITVKGPNAEANYRLTVAAPDLLEALKEIIKYENKKPINKRDYEIKAIAKQAISKAEGKQ